MARLTDITTGELRYEASLRLTENKAKCTLSAKACELLSLTKEDNKIRFVTVGNDRRVYVCHTKRATGIPVYFEKNSHRKTGCIYSKKLFAMLSERLQGPGLYRICEEDVITDDWDTNTKAYGIFFKKIV